MQEKPVCNVNIILYISALRLFEYIVYIYVVTELLNPVNRT